MYNHICVLSEIIFGWQNLEGKDCHGCDPMVLDLQLPMQSVPITTDVVSLNLDQGEVYNIMWSSLSVIHDRSAIFSGSSGFLHQ